MIMQTSALDAHTESELLRSIYAALISPSHGKPRTSVFIAHRLRTVIEADLIIVLKDGQVIEQGTHEELLAIGGLYKSMWAQQSSFGDENVVMDGSTSEGGMLDQKEVDEKVKV